MTGKWPNSEISYLNGKPSNTEVEKPSRKQHCCQIAALRESKLKRLRLERSENHARFPPKTDIRG